MPVLEGLSHSHFDGGSFTDKSSITYNNSWHYSTLKKSHSGLNSSPVALRMLHANVLPGATHDSYNRRYKATRPDYINIPRLELRVEGLEATLHFLNLKQSSAHSTELASYLDRSNRLVASYVAEALDTPVDVQDVRKFFFPTIASQLAIHFPQIAAQLETILRSDPTIFTKSIDTQCQQLIIEPFKRLLDWKKTPKYIVIDGLLDHCDRQDAIGVLNVLGHALKQLPFPIHVLVFSKSAQGIEEAMADPFLRTMSRTVALHDIFDDGGGGGDGDEADRMDVCED